MFNMLCYVIIKNDGKLFQLGKGVCLCVCVFVFGRGGGGRKVGEHQSWKASWWNVYVI